MTATPKRILLVDDHPRNLLALSALLEPLGHELIRATDGHAALASFEARRPDLVLLDLVMPGFSGLEVLARIRSSPGGADVPVVLVTAHSDRERRLEGLEAGADDFLEKPIDEAILLARVRTLLALKSSRDELELRLTALRQSQREQRELTEFIVHDLRNPLSVVCSGIEWTSLNLLPAQADLIDTLDDVRNAASRLRVMINDLLTISRLETASFPLRIEKVPVAELLRAVARAYAAPAAERGVTLVGADDLPVEVEADRALLRRVVENLMDNALRYTPKHGRIALGLRLIGGAEISVSNDGVPIPTSELESIFEKFRRGHAERAGMGNAGLGLYFCRRALEAHGGAIRVARSRDWPTTFAINLPVSGAAGTRVRAPTVPTG
ncbi:MAG: Pole remodelling regulatory diguanylate cyclase [Myxococcaceae bacterium]|nr:Pole remodelling regulatory diguanylate cyclase [Myxococcaceae bacterium]